MLKPGGLFAPISREGTLVLNNIFLTAACTTAFVGTLYPLMLDAVTGEKISVGAPFLNATFAPLFVPLLFAVPFGPLMAWKRGDLLGVAQPLIGAAVLALIIVAGTVVIAGVNSVLAPFAISLAAFVMAGAVTALTERAGFLRSHSYVALKRLTGLPRSAFATALAHFGLRAALLGVVCETQWGAERITALKPAEIVSLRGYDLSYDGLTPRQGPNYRELVGKFTVRRGATVIGVMEPSKRTFPARSSSTTQAALMTRGVSKLYLSLGDSNVDGSIVVRLYHKPLVLRIWLGPLIMVCGGALVVRPPLARRRAQDRKAGHAAAAASGVKRPLILKPPKAIPLTIAALFAVTLLPLGGPCDALLSFTMADGLSWTDTRSV